MAEVGDRAGVPGAIVRRAVAAVLRGERAGRTTITVTVLSVQRMRALNRRTFGRDRATDVIAFGMQHDRTLVGDMYVCPAVARRSARRFGVTDREEMLRLVVHGTLHVLGYDHPGGDGRTRSAMWRRQERYLAGLLWSRP